MDATQRCWLVQRKDKTARLDWVYNERASAVADVNDRYLCEPGKWEVVIADARPRKVEKRSTAPSPTETA